MWVTLAFLIALSFIAWRIASHYIIIPWPHWLSWMLEAPNPYMMAFSNSHSIVNKLALRHGMSIADLGCGAGRVLIPAAQKIGCQGIAHGYDIQKEMLAKTEARAQKHHLNHITLTQTELKTGILQEEFYDRIIMVTVLGEVPDRKAILSESYKALKSGGILSITEVIPDPCYITHKTLRKSCQEIGFIHSQTWKSLLAYTSNFSK